MVFTSLLGGTIRARPQSHFGEPELMSSPWPLADPGPEQPRHKVKSRSTARGPRHCYPWRPIRAGYFVEGTLGTYWARTWGSDSAESAFPLATRGFQGWA